MKSQNNYLIYTLPLLLLLFTGCSKHEEMMFMATFFFAVIFIVFCIPAIILAGVSRSARSNAPKTISIIFTSIGGFFALIYSVTWLGDPWVRGETQIMMYLFLLWGTLIGSAIMLGMPKQPQPEIKPQNKSHAQATQKQENRPMSEEEILAAAEKIKQKKAEQKPASESEFFNPEPNKGKDDSVDMSGLDDLADL